MSDLAAQRVALIAEVEVFKKRLYGIMVCS